MGRRAIGDDSGAFDPTKHAHELLMGHVAAKGFQAGAVLGVPLVPIVLRLRGRPISMASYARGVAGMSVAFTAVSCAFGMYKMQSMTDDGLHDRVYRLHYNEGQNRTDQFSAIGAGAGSVLFLAARRGAGLSLPGALLGGAAIGCAIGVAAHVATSNEFSIEKMKKEL